MKLSLSWIFDHIVGDWRTIDITRLVDTFNRTTAAIEHVSLFELATQDLSLAIVKESHDGFVTVFSTEWQKTIELPARLDAIKNSWFLIKTNKDGGFSWGTISDCGAQAKDGIMPSIFCSKRDQAGAWKKTVEANDYILELDNPSITHRPDLWGARGIAREFAAILKLKLRPASHFLEEIETITHDTNTYQAPNTPPLAPTLRYIRHFSERNAGHSGCTDAEIIQSFSITNQAPTACTRYAGLQLSEITTQASILPLALRLCRIDQRPINLLVDCANYTMLDWGQPLHVFDAQKISSHTIVPRMAHVNEDLLLLDGTTIKLTSNDLVITDGKKPIALAGIMGGANSVVDQQTNSVFIESAHFNSATIRTTSSTNHLRTDASVRFEKGLDPNQIEDAVKRMIKLLKQAKISYQQTAPLIALGAPMTPYEITISHDIIEARLGIIITPKQIAASLRSIDFTVTKKKKNYHIIVPTFRGTKSVTIAEDIIDEIGRLIGWDSITPVLPQWSMTPHVNQSITHMRNLKQQLAFALNMHEVRNYPFFDEQFLQEINWHPEHAIKAKNPLSLNVTQLVTSLVPHLFMNVQQNTHKQDFLNFFECNRIWSLDADQKPQEQKSCAGILWHTKNPINFYTGKHELSSLFNALGLTIKWKKTTKTLAAWYNPNQTAQLTIDNQLIGYAGTSNSTFTHEKIPGAGFVFELNLDILSPIESQISAFKPLSKYPYVYLDISMLVSLEKTVESLEQLIQSVDTRIYNVALVDMFYRDEWRDQRSLTFRYYMRDLERTLTKEDIDTISLQVINTINGIGAQIR